jgi:2,3-dihydroxybiphenyl 1,2-dioxygenase
VSAAVADRASGILRFANVAPPNPSLFGRMRLGYVLVESTKLDAWQRFAADGLGVHVDNVAADVLALRIDQYQRRVVVRRGPAEDVTALGWQLDDDAALQQVLKRLRGAGVVVHEHAGDAAALRGVERVWSFEGPKRIAFELFTRPVLDAAPLRMVSSGFVTGCAGMGHVAITTREPDAALAFLRDIFDARVSDFIEDRVNGVTMDITFLRLNERHHSLALAATRGRRMDPLRTRIHHVNLQAQRWDDVVAAYRRLREMGHAMANAIGQHPNDRELSFYVTTPSGFDIELGWNPIVVDAQAEAGWQTATYHGISLWGHFPESLTTTMKLRQMTRALSSLARKEYVPGVTS